MIKAHFWSTPKFPHPSLDFVKILSINTDFFFLKPQLTTVFPRELVHLGVAKFCCSLFPVLEKPPRLSAHSNASGIRRKSPISEPSTPQADKWTSLRRSERTDSLPVSVLPTSDKAETAPGCQGGLSRGSPPTQLRHHQRCCLQGLSNTSTDSPNTHGGDYSWS